VDRLSQEMVAGKFRLSPDAILLIQGKVANGQHRLSAVVKSNTTQRFMVLSTNDDKLYEVVDSVMKRNVAENAGVSDGYNVSAIGAYACGYRSRKLDCSNNPGKKSLRSDIVEFIGDSSEEIHEAKAIVLPMYKKQHLLSISMGAAIYMIAKDKEKAKTFLEECYSGKGDSSAIDLRERLIKNRLSKAKLHTGHIFALAVKAFRSYCNGSRPAVLKIVEGEDFPYLD
jgi:hypothetical protein